MRAHSRLDRLLTLVAVIAALAARPAGAQSQTTGDIAGQVKDDSGAALPGVTAEAKSRALLGVRSATSDGRGAFRLTLLPPGLYHVTLTMQGFKTETKDVTVSLGHESALEATLHPSLAENIEVSAALPVDTTTTAVGTNVVSEVLETLPTGRTYTSVVQIAPGVSSDVNPENRDQATITVYGSAGNENAFYIDGVNTTGVEYGFQGKDLNYEFVQELDVKTGGYEAEYGGSTGGIINVITKSGGNTFHGDLFGYLDDDGLQRDAHDTGSAGGTIQGFRKHDIGGDLGGYIVKDRLWFFGAYDRVRNTYESLLASGPRAGQTASSESTRDLASLKLTWKLNDAHRIVGTFFQDPRDDSGAVSDAQHTLNGDPVTYAGKQKFGGRDFAARYEGVVGTKWSLSAQVSRHGEENSILPATSAGDQVQYRDAAQDFFQTGGFGLIQEKTFRRTGANGTATRFLGPHTVKFGGGYDEETADVTKRMSGGQQVDVVADPVNPARTIYRHSYWTTPDATVDDAPISALRASPKHKTTSLFVQDSFAVNKDLTINAGLRWDRQQIVDASGVQQIDLSKDVAPRLGVTWDPTHDDRTKVYGSFGRFYERLPMDLVIRSFSFERQPRIINFDPVSVRPDAVAEADLGTSSAILGGYTEPSDPDIKGQYVREFVIGADRAVRKDLTLGVKGVFRDYGRVIEDFLCMDDGTYCIGNPGHGIMREVFTLDYSQTFPAPKPKRSYRAIQVDATKRLGDNWQGLASYVFSKLDGNFDGEYAPFTNIGADPNISAAYDYYDFFTNGSDLGRITNNGPLSNDRRHQLKVSGVYFSPWKLSVGLSAYVRSGVPLTRYGFSEAYGRYEFFLTPRGAEGRSPATYDADLHLGYPLKIHPVTANLLLDVFNVFNTQRPILLDQRWGFQEADNASPVPVNPRYLKPVLRTPPTAVRLGLRLSF